MGPRADEPDEATGNSNEPVDRADTEENRMMRAEQEALILGPALELTEQDWVDGLMRPRGPPPPMAISDGSASASGSGSSATMQPTQTVSPALETTTCQTSEDQHTPQRVSRERSRSTPRVPARRQRPSTLGGSAAALE